MEQLKLYHLILVSVWGGLALAEAVLEFNAGSASESRLVAKVHFLIDSFVEIPVLIGVLITGFLLIIRMPEISPAFWLKIICGLIAISFNFLCFVLVIIRHKRTLSDIELAKYHKWVRYTGFGLPFGLIAAVIGFTRLFS